MKIKRKYIIMFLILFMFIILFLVGSFEYIKINKDKTPIDLDENINLNIPDNEIEFMQSLVGLESKDMKILDNPLRIEGSFYIPEETVESYINHYLKTSNNKDIENIKVTINKNGITIGGQYKLFTYLKTPIDIDILPTVTEDNNLSLQLKDIRLLSLSLSEKIIDAVVESWFSDLENIRVTNGDVIINKAFFKNSEIKDINVKEDYLVINLSVRFK